MAYWGDTISSFSIENRILARMDLILIRLCNYSLETTLDFVNAEFAKKESESKYYKDLLKAVLPSNIHLNKIIKSFPDIESRVFYPVDDVCTISIPLSLKEMKDEGILDLMKKPLLPKNIYLDTKAIADEKDGLLEAAKMPVITKNKKKKKKMRKEL
ncbi:hypothetical protein K501DRAFT_267852 [Backusella circina FSU 941]|nr:hypothetical protein K501DRAFT_267852 [Backusella circina FSU 941]